MQRILATRQRVVKKFVFLKSNALFNAFLREEGGTRMRDGRSLRDPHFFACFITTAFPKLRALPQSPTATAPSRREPFTKHILPLSLVYFSSPAIASFEPRDYRVVFVIQKRTKSIKAPRPFLTCTAIVSANTIDRSADSTTLSCEEFDSAFF